MRFDAGRNVVARCVSRLKQGRGIATRCKQHVANYRVAIGIAALVLWLAC